MGCALCAAHMHIAHIEEIYALIRTAIRIGKRAVEMRAWFRNQQEPRLIWTHTRRLCKRWWRRFGAAQR